jgi:PadR family transcriptional regulator PadR
MPNDALTLLPGTVDVLILKTLTWGPMHGYALSNLVRQRSDGSFSLEDAALYQGLHRLERRGLVESEWGLSDNNRRAKFYSLTTAGRAALRAELAELRRYTTALFKVLELA